MTYLLLLVNSEGQVATSRLLIRELREFPGGEGVSVHFRPVRNDLLFESAKVAGRLAYRILSGEGIVRSQLWVEYEVLGPHVNVTGRSSDLLFALALITSKWKKSDGHYPAIAATGVLDPESATLTGNGTAAVEGVKHAVEKVAGAVSALVDEREAVIFYPAADAEGVEAWSAGVHIPAHIRLHPAGSIEDALSVLGISLEKVYLGNPFRGLEHFDYRHRAIFFGRDAEVTELLAQLLRREAAAVPGALVDGASGSGKSSFLRAGVLPALVRPDSQPTDIAEALRLRPVHDTVRWAIWRVGLLPTNADEARIAQSIRACWQSLPELAASMAGQVETLTDLLKQRRAAWPVDQRFVWFLDQFEELFTLGLPESVIDIFGRFLIDLQSEGVWTLASIRADAVPQLRQHPSLRQVFGSNEGQYYLGTINATALDDVINRPAQAAGLCFGTGPSGGHLDQALREDAYRDRENALPLLQFTLHELYQRRSGKELTYAAYEQLGGLAGSVATIAEAVLKAEGVESQWVVPRLFRHLVTVDEAGGASRRYAPIAEVAEEHLQKRLLLSLVQARLCVTDQREGQPVVAFAHEALLRTWPALVDWLQQEAGLLQTRELAQRETRLWQKHGQSDDWLATADKLVTFKHLQSAGIALSEPVCTFIERSTRRSRRTTLVKRAAVSAIALLAIVASAAGWIASRKQHEAEYQTSEALQAQSRLLVEAAAQRLKNANVEDTVARAQGIILEVLTNPRFRQERSDAAISVFEEIRAADNQLAVLDGHSDYVASVAYSHDGAHIVTASFDKTSRVWDAHTGVKLSVLTGHGDRVTSAAFAPNDEHIVTASNDKTVRIWDAQTGAQLGVLSGHEDRVYSAAYSPDGTRIVTASADKTVRVWDARTHAQLYVLSGHSDRVHSASYSPDGAHIVTASHDKTARIWDARTGAQLMVLSGHGDPVWSATYSPDGTRIVTASVDGTAQIWDARTGAKGPSLLGHKGAVYYAAYSPDGANVVTASGDKTSRIWDARTGTQLALLSGHSNYVISAAYSPDGLRIVTGAMDQTARIWDAHTGAELTKLGHPDQVYSAVFSDDGRSIVTASKDKTARIWDVHSAAQLSILSGHSDTVVSAAFSPDGTRIVTASFDKTARIWNPTTGKQIGALLGHDDMVDTATYSPDGARIVTASADKTARIWDAHTGAQLAVLSGHTARVRSVTYSSDGSRLVSAGWDNTARIWDARTGAQLAVLTGHNDIVWSAVYSPDDRRIVTASGDKTARIWDARTGAQLAVLVGHEDLLTSAVFSPNGLQIATTSNDKTARIWDARTGTQLAVLTGHTGAVYSANYSPDGTRIVTASDDATARIWEGRIPAMIEAQITWELAAETDPLPERYREQLSLPAGPRVRTWPSESSDCDRAAAAFYDPDRRAAGKMQVSIDADIANAKCAAETGAPGHARRSDYQMARALLAKHDVKSARREFELAVAEGYRAAQIDLADLLHDDAAGTIDLPRAVQLNEKAWSDGVPVAAYELGYLYELGARSAPASAKPSIQPDMAKAWSWYQKGADAREPNALARIAERDERNALIEKDPFKRDALLLQSFRNYAAAAEYAKNEDWPDEAWRHWRYRRATLARLLAREGMMQQVADTYTSVCGK